MKAVSIQILHVLGILCLVALARGQPKAPVKCSTECNHLTSKIPEKLIRSYRRTEPNCRKQAIIFITLRSKEICANPETEHVKKIVEKLDQKKATASPLPRDATSPEEPGGLQKHVGLIVMAPSQDIAPTSFFQETSTIVLERIHGPAVGTEVSSKSPPARQDRTQLPAGLSPVVWEHAAHSEVTPEAKRVSLNSTASSTIVAAGVDSSQPTPQPTALVRGSSNTVGSTEGPAGHAVSATAHVQDMISPNPNSGLMATTKGSGQSVLSTNEALDSASARTNGPDTASNSSISDIPSILDSVDNTIILDMTVPPETTSVSTLNPTTSIDKSASVHSNKVVGSSADVFGTETFDYSLPAGKQEPSILSGFTGQAFSGQATVQMTTDRPNNLPLHRSRSQTHFVIPVSVVSGLMICTVGLVWLYLKFGVKPEELSREMVQGLLCQKTGHKYSAYPMEVI